mgnify:CR=1 FL=1
MFTIVSIYFLDNIKVRLSDSRHLLGFTIEDIYLAFADGLSFLSNSLTFPMVDHVIKEFIGCGKPGIVIRIGVLSIYDDCDNTHPTFI